MSLDSLPIPAGILLMAILSVSLTLAFCFALHRWLKPEPSDENRQITTVSSARVGTMLSLILALVFNFVFREYNELSESIDNEAVVLSLVLEDISEELPREQVTILAPMLQGYITAVLNEDWQSKAPMNESLSADWILYQMRQWLDGLQNEFPNAIDELDSLLDEVDRLRMQRLLDHDTQLPPLFWPLVLSLYLLSLVPMSQFEPSRIRSLYLGSYGLATGMVLYGILLYASPFQSSLPVDDSPFRFVLSSIDAELARHAGGAAVEKVIP